MNQSPKITRHDIYWVCLMGAAITQGINMLFTIGPAGLLQIACCSASLAIKLRKINSVIVE